MIGLRRLAVTMWEHLVWRETIWVLRPDIDTLEVLQALRDAPRGPRVRWVQRRGEA